MGDLDPGILLDTVAKVMVDNNIVIAKADGDMEGEASLAIEEMEKDQEEGI